MHGFYGTPPRRWRLAAAQDSLGALRNALRGAQLTGTELFQEGLSVARQRWPNIRLMQADARALPFDSEFDLVAAFDVLEHIDDDTRALAELRTVVRPGGGLIVTVPSISGGGATLTITRTTSGATRGLN